MPPRTSPKSFGKTKCDVHTDILAREVCDVAISDGNEFAAVIALVRRAYVDLNRPIEEAEQIGDPMRVRCWRAYHESIRNLVLTSVNSWGGCILVDIHGHNRKQISRAQSGISRADNNIYLGTQYGALVPDEEFDIYFQFQNALVKAGYRMLESTLVV